MILDLLILNYLFSSDKKRGSKFIPMPPAHLNPKNFKKEEE